MPKFLAFDRHSLQPSSLFFKQPIDSLQRRGISKPRSIALMLLSGLAASINVSCSVSVPGAIVGQVPVSETVSAATTDSTPAGAAVGENPTSSSPTSDSSAQSDPYAQAIARASSAVNMSQSAASQDDWKLVASRWQQAIEFLTAVPRASTNYAIAQRKLSEYRRNLAFAQQQASRSTALRNPDGVVRINAPAQPVSNVPQTAYAPQAAPFPPSQTSANGQVFRAPIIGRAGGTPVISVTFNGNQHFEMIVDTGASGTLITQRMAQALSVVPVGQAQVSTASARSVSFPLGYVQSIEVNGAIAEDVLVAVAGSNLEIGLLGHDFFGNYDVTIRQHEVEFRAR